MSEGLPWHAVMVCEALYELLASLDNSFLYCVRSWGCAGVLLSTQSPPFVLRLPGIVNFIILGIQGAYFGRNLGSLAIVL